jgi:hypothetical protein
MNQPIHDLVREQARKLEEDCEKGALRDTLLAARWHHVNLWLGISSAVAAALAAFFVGKGNFITDQLKDHLGEQQKAVIEVILPMITAFSALAAAILTSTLTFLAPSEKAGAYHHFSNKLRALRDRARSFIEIDCTMTTSRGTNLPQKFEQLLREKREIESSHPIVPYWVYAKSYVEMKKKIEFKNDLKKLNEQSEVDKVQRLSLHSISDRIPGTPVGTKQSRQ